MTDDRKQRRKWANWIDAVLELGEDVDIDRLVLDSIRLHGYGESSVKKYLELKYNAGEIVTEKLTNTVRRKQKKREDVGSFHVSDFGRPTEDDGGAV